MVRHYVTAVAKLTLSALGIKPVISTGSLDTLGMRITTELQPGTPDLGGPIFKIFLFHIQILLDYWSTVGDFWNTGQGRGPVVLFHMGTSVDLAPLDVNTIFFLFTELIWHHL